VRAAPAALLVFDVLLVDGNDLRNLPLRERQARLADLVQTGPGLQLVRSLAEHGEALLWAKIKNPSYSRQEALGFR